MSRRRAVGDARRWPGLGFGAALFFAYVYLPIVILVVLSFNENRVVTVWTGFSLEWYRMALQNDDIVQAAINSLLIASVASAARRFLRRWLPCAWRRRNSSDRPA